jgi:tRNA modification GTPase
VHSRDDTIAAIATGWGTAALGIVRISGPGAAGVLHAVVPKSKAGSRPRQVIASTAYHPDSGTPIDEVLCFTCKGPGTATGEDTAEIQGHGGRVVMKRLLDAVLAAGAQVAEPGEFTYRAYTNGRIDLTQAEAVMGLIGAQSDRAARVAFRQLEGGLSRSLDQAFQEIIAVSAEVEAGLDFPDEDLPLATIVELAGRLEAVSSHLESVSASFALGERLTRGARVAIIGPPNAGKSTLLNCLVQEDRALVDPEPGTTRDVVEARAEAEGIPLVFMETAGLRQTPGRIEKQGIDKTLETTQVADLLIIVLDGTNRQPGYVDEVARLIPESTAKLLIAVNKKDLPGWQADLTWPAQPDHSPPTSVPISALTGEGAERLKEVVAELLGNEGDEEEAILTTARQYAAVTGCLEHVTKATRLLQNQEALELAAADLRWGREKIAALWGKSATDEMLDAIFSTFCLGK